MARIGAHPPGLDGNYLAGRAPSQLPAELVDESMMASAQDAPVGNLGLAAWRAPTFRLLRMSGGGMAPHGAGTQGQPTRQMTKHARAPHAKKGTHPRGLRGPRGSRTPAQGPLS